MQFLFLPTILILLLGNNTIAQELNIEWGRQIGGTDVDWSRSMVFDDFGNVYTTGIFRETVDFDPGAGILNLTSNGDGDIYIQKLDASGDLIWVRQMGGNGWDSALAIALDNLGNIYTAGRFAETVDFDPGVGVLNLTSNGGEDIYIQKLDASGNLVWVKQMGGEEDDAVSSIAIDDLDNVYTIGYFGGIADFDPGVGTLNLTSNGGIDIYIQKLDGLGNLVWVKQMGGEANDLGRAIALDDLGNVYAMGGFRETADFDPGVGMLNLTSNGVVDIYIQKLDESGDLVWAKQIGGEGWDAAEVIALDDSGNIYTAGEFDDTADFDPGAGVLNLTSNGGDDIFIQKLDGSGDLIWVKQIGGESDIAVRSIVFDDLNNIYTVGYFGGTIDFDPGGGTLNLTSIGGVDIYIQKLDGSGDLVWAKQIGGDNNDFGEGIAFDNFGSIYTVGTFTQTVDFDPGAGMFNLSSNGGEDIFIIKLNEQTTSTDELVSSLGILVYPNPTTYLLEIDKGSNAEIAIDLFDNLGQKIISVITTDQNTSLDLINYTSAVYFLSINNGENTITQKIIKLK